MGSFDFSPKFPDKLAETLDDRAQRIAEKEPKWMYQKYAYFSIKGKQRAGYGTTVSLSEQKDNGLDDKSVFSLIPLGEEDLIIIESVKTGSADGYLDAFHNDPNDITTFKPYVVSANIDSSQGKNIIQTGISTVTVQIKAYTTSDLNKIEKNFFQPGREAIIKYGWRDESNLVYENKPSTGNEAEFEISIFNFGFTTNTDGSFDVNIKGITKEASFLESDTLSKLYEIDQTAAKKLGAKIQLDGVSLPEKLLTDAMEEFTNKGDCTIGKMIKSDKTYGSDNRPAYYVGRLVDTIEGNFTSELFYYINFENFIRISQSEKKSDFKSFVFHSSETSMGYPSGVLDSVSSALNDPTKAFPAGSADPRKYIFPGKLAYYGPQPLNPTGNDDDFYDILAGVDQDIKYMLISLDTIARIYKEISEDKELAKDNEKAAPVTTIEFIRRMSKEVFKLSGGQVDIQTIRESSDNVNTGDRFVIFNNTVAAQKVNNDVYYFNLLTQGSLVRDLQVSSDFNVKTQMMLNCGRVRNGELNIAPLQEIYDVPNIQRNDELSSGRLGLNGFLIKATMAALGVSDRKVDSLVDAMRKYNNIYGKTFRVFPFFLKLRVTIDGIHGIPFLSTISTDRLPPTYDNGAVYFVVTGVEHSFQGGDWSTTIESSMKIKS